MTDDQDEPTHRTNPPVDDPTYYGPTSGHLPGNPPPDEPTVDTSPRTTAPDNGAPFPETPDHGTSSHGTVRHNLADHSPTGHDAADREATSRDIDGSPTIAFRRTAETPAETPAESTTELHPESSAESAGGTPSLADALFDERTTEIDRDEATTTGPTVGSWPPDQPDPPPPDELIWRVPPPPVDESGSRSPSYYIGLGAAVVLVVGLLAATAILTVVRPTREVAGTARPAQEPPTITAAPTTTTASTTMSRPTSAGDPEKPAGHPLSTSTTRMADTTCDLPRFDPADDQQAAFYTAAKKCADNAWRDILAETGLEGEVRVVTVTSTQRTGCGEITPASPATYCEDTVYLTPAHLRDTEGNGRYPGKYLGVLLREYAGALQHTTGLTALPSTMDTEDGNTRLAQQATCLAGVMSGAMNGRGAVDTNITGEIADRLTTVDAPTDAKSWLDKGFTERTPAACNAWAN